MCSTFVIVLTTISISNTVSVLIKTSPQKISSQSLKIKLIFPHFFALRSLRFISFDFLGVITMLTRNLSRFMRLWLIRISELMVNQSLVTIRQIVCLSFMEMRKFLAIIFSCLHSFPFLRLMTSERVVKSLCDNLKGK